MSKNKLRQEIDEKMALWLTDHKIIVLRPSKSPRKGIKSKPYQNSLSPCPSCGSRLIVENSGVISCSQKKLSEWYKKCLEYDKANKHEQIQLLADNSQLLEMYDRWKQKDASGNRPYFMCDYSNKLFSPLPNYSFLMPDPIQVKRLERRLKRRLFEAELNGTVKVIFKDRSGKVYEERIELYRFPFDLMSGKL